MPDNASTKSAIESNRGQEQEETLKKLLDMYMPSVIESIHMRAESISGSQKPNAKDYMAALQEYIPGVPANITKQRWSWINQNVTGFMAITAFMTLIFGVLGIVPQVKVEGFLEIAKIFAGALVGGAAGAAAGSRRP